MTDKAQMILDKALPNIPYDGWNIHVLRRSARASGLDEAYAEIAFPNGVEDAVKLFLARIDARMEALYKAREADLKGVGGKIKGALLCRFEAMDEHREVIRKTVQYLSNPLHAPFSLSVSYQTVDKIWHMIGDKTSDSNFYTKRMTLAGVYNTTLLYWLQDDSENYHETEAFLDRRLKNVMQIGKFRKSVEDKLNDCLSFFKSNKA